MFEPLLSAREAAKLLTIHENTLTKWARANRITSHRLGRRIAFRASELDAWLARGGTLVTPFVPPNHHER